MKTPQLLFFLLTLFTSIHALTIPTSFDSASHLFKRKGGGGGGGRGGGGFSSSSGSRGSSSSSSSSSRGGSSSSGSRGTPGVGPQPRTYGSGAYYGGGAARPYPASRRTPNGLVAVPFIGAAGVLGVGALAYGYYYYPYNTQWTYHNESANENQTRPVDCYCGKYNPCACEQRNDQDYINSVANNQSISRVADVNGTETLLVNGTLPNGTTVAENLAVKMGGGLGQFGGWAVIGGAVAWGVWLM